MIITITEGTIQSLDSEKDLMFGNMVMSKVLAATGAPALGFTTPEWLELAALWFTLPNMDLHWATAVFCSRGPQTTEAPGNTLMQRDGLGDGKGCA